MRAWQWLLVIFGAATAMIWAGAVSWGFLGPSDPAFLCKQPLLLPTPMTFCSALGRTDSYLACANALGVDKYFQQKWMLSNETDRDVDLFLHYRHVVPSFCERDHRDLLVEWEKRGYRALGWRWPPSHGFYFVHFVF